MLESRTCREFQKDYSVKPPEHEQVTFVMHVNRKTGAQYAEVINRGQNCLPEGEEE